MTNEWKVSHGGHKAETEMRSTRFLQQTQMAERWWLQTAQWSQMKQHRLWFGSFVSVLGCSSVSECGTAFFPEKNLLKEESPLLTSEEIRWAGGSTGSGRRRSQRNSCLGSCGGGRGWGGGVYGRGWVRKESLCSKGTYFCIATPPADQYKQQQINQERNQRRGKEHKREREREILLSKDWEERG